MSGLENLNALQSVLAAIPSDEVMAPNMPSHVAVQEAENLLQWALSDKDALVAAGLDSKIFDEIEPASLALRYAEGMWVNVRYSRAEARKMWNEESVVAFALRERLDHDFLFAYRNNEEVLAKVRAISAAGVVSDKIQDLINLSMLGQQNGEELVKIGFDVTLLDTAAAMAERLGTLLGRVTADSSGENSVRDQRDRTFTHLKKLVDEVREHGKYLFYRDEERCRGYVSNYFKRNNRAALRAKKAEQPTQLADAA